MNTQQNLDLVVKNQRDRFLEVRSDPNIEFAREAQFALQYLTQNDYLAKVAAGNPESLKSAVVNVAAIGISLNPASKLAYLVPRKGGVCLDISYMGLMHIAQQTGAIQWGQAQIVRQTDKFELHGVDKQPTHTFNPFDTERGDIVGVYIVVKTDGGDFLTHAMPIADVYAIRDRSDAWKSYKNDNSKTCPWVTDAQEMIKKTCVKQAAKYWPRRERLDTAVHHVNTEGDEGITITQNKMPEDEFNEFVRRIEATTSHEAAKAVYGEAMKVCAELKDRQTAESLKEITIKHREFIDSAKQVELEAA